MKFLINVIAAVFISTLFFSCSFSGDDDDSITQPGQTTDLRNPSPANGATNQSLVVTLSWDYTGDDAASYDVYFEDKTPPTTQIASGRTQRSIIVPGLDYNKRYYWQVVVNKIGGGEEEGPIWSFTTKARGTSADGFVMIDYGLETEEPSFVKILFQVLDLNGIGVDNLTTSDFELFEDGVQISPAESNLKILKRAELPYTLNIVLMLDNSTSLQNQLADIKLGAVDLINSLGSQFQMAIYKFSENPVLVQDFTFDKGVLTSAVNTIQTEFPTTDLYGSVIEGASKMEESISTDEIQQSAMILFTDGDDTQDEYTLAEALQAVSSKRVYTVGLGTDIKPEVLEAIGNAGFFAIADVNELSETFLQIEDELEKYANSFYQLEYQSPKRGNRNHDLLLRIIDNPNNSVITGTFNSKDFFSTTRGLYINANADNVEGIKEINLPPNGVRTLQASSYFVDNDPVYEWLSLAPNIVTIEVSQNDPSQATVEAVGVSGQSATIRVRDTANGLTALLTVNIN